MRFLVCCVATAALCIAGASPRLHATAACVRCHAPPVCMAKGDGKKSRPPKAPAPPPGPPMAPPEVAPRSGRITQGGAVSGSGNVLSVRQQIAIVRSFKKMAAAGPASPARRTSFRKIAKEGGERNTTKAVDEDVEVDLRDPLLFIDGYNVINMWPRLKKRFQKGELLEAREMLLADVADFTISRFESVVVFDANGAADRVEGKDREETYASGLVRVVYAHDSADAYIERETKTQRAEGRPVRVATSDNGIATACAMYGATVVSSQFMVTELKASRNAAAAILDEFNRRQVRAQGGHLLILIASDCI